MFDNRNQKMALIAVVCLVIAGIILGYNYSRGSYSQSGSGRDDGIWMKCRNPECKAEFQITEQQYSDFLHKVSGGAPGLMSSVPGYKCRECGEKSAYEAVKCPECSNVFERGAAGDNAYPDECPECGYSQRAEKRAQR